VHSNKQKANKRKYYFYCCIDTEQTTDRAAEELKEGGCGAF
jgi:hypothetical protein